MTLSFSEGVLYNGEQEHLSAGGGFQFLRKKVAVLPLIQPMSENYADFLCDESRTMGTADYIAFPQCEADIVEVMKFCREKSLCINPQGGLTGLSGGASPAGGMILNLSKMKRILGIRRDASGTYFLRVQPGIRLFEVRQALAEMEFDTTGWSEEAKETLREIAPGQLFFSPDPTEPTASIGGMASCNACGARSFLYGCTRAHIHALRIVLASGDTLSLTRGREKAMGRHFSILLDSGETLQGMLPDFDTPPIKDAGYFIRQDMDLVDLFMGSQGTLGIISELELSLMPSPGFMGGVLAFLPDDETALRYVHTVKQENRPGLPSFSVRPASIEFFNRQALDMLLEQRKVNAAFQKRIPDLPEGIQCAVYTEFNVDTEEIFHGVLDELNRVLTTLGGDPEKTWMASGTKELENLLFFRHAVPETIDILVAENKKNYEGITILSTDMAVDDAHFDTLFRLYNDDLKASGLPWIIFGHIGENHVHPNILARNREEYEQGHALFERWAAIVSGMGGTITAEHGAGKIKRKLALIMYGKEKMQELNRLKRLFDPENRLAPGNILTELQKGE